MDQQDDSYDQDDMWQAFTELPLHLNPATTSLEYPPSTCPFFPPTLGSVPSAPEPVHYDDSRFFTTYSTQMPFSPSEPTEQPSAAYNPYTGGVSPSIASESSHSAGSPSHRTRHQSSSSTTSRIVTRDQLRADPILRNEGIQTVEEARKSRRRRQNREAQQTFKTRKKRREKELEEQVEAAEELCKTLEAEKKELEEELSKKKEERSSSIAGISGNRESERQEDQEQRRSSK